MNRVQGSGFRVQGSALSVALILGAFVVAAGAESAPAPATAAAPFFKAGEEVTLLADGPGKGQQDTPHVAFGKNQYLVVWREGSMVESGRARILAGRVSSDPSAGSGQAAKVLDPKAIEVAPNKNADGPQAYPRVAFCQDVFLVVWQDFRNGKDYDVLGARISSEGKVLDAEPIAVAAGGGTQAMPDVASDGKGFMVVFQSHPDSPQKLGYRSLAVPVGVDGKVGAAAEVMDQPHPVIAWDGTNYLVAAGGAHTTFIGCIYTRLLGPKDSKPQNMQPFLPGAPPQLSISAQPGKGWLIVNHRVLPDFWGWGGPAAMRAYFLTPDGKLTKDLPEVEKKTGHRPGELQPGWLDIQKAQAPTPPGTGIPVGPNASVWGGRHFVVVWQRFHQARTRGYDMILDNCDLIIGRVDGWKPLDPYGVPVVDSPAEEKWPALATDGAGGLLLVYTKSAPDGRVQVTARPIRMQE